MSDHVLDSIRAIEQIAIAKAARKPLFLNLWPPNPHGAVPSSTTCVIMLCIVDIVSGFNIEGVDGYANTFVVPSPKMMEVARCGVMSVPPFASAASV